jgi:hypothetical protein
MCCESSAHARAHLPEQNSPGPISRPLLLLVFVFPSLFRPPNPSKSNDSRTSAAFARKSNHSRTYAKTGGWGGYVFVIHSVTYLKYVGAPTFSFRPASALRAAQGKKVGPYTGRRNPRTRLKAGHYKGDQDDRGIIRSAGLRRGRVWRLSWRAIRRRSGRCLR